MKKLALTVAVSLVLLGCGGSSSSDTTEPVVPPPVDPTNWVADTSVHGVVKWRLTDDLNCRADDCLLAPSKPTHSPYLQMTMDSINYIEDKSNGYREYHNKNTGRRYSVGQSSPTLYRTYFNESDYDYIGHPMVYSYSDHIFFRLYDSNSTNTSRKIECSFYYATQTGDCTYYYENDYIFHGLTDIPRPPSKSNETMPSDLINGEYSIKVLNYALNKMGLDEV